MGIFSWFSDRKRIARIERQIAQLTQVVAAQHHPAGFDVGTILDAAGKATASNFESTTNFLRMVQEIAMQQASQKLGRKGGRARVANAERDARGRLLPARRVGSSRSDCPLCRNPLTANFSTKQWDAHQEHGEGNNGNSAEREPVTERPPIEVVAEPAVDRPSPQYPLPVVTRDSDDSGAGIHNPGNGEANGVGENHLH